MDYLVEEVESREFLDKFGAENADLYGVEQYRDFRGAADRTLKSILITLNATISRLKTPQLMRVFENDEMRLDRIDEGKRMIDLKVSDNDSANAWLRTLPLSSCLTLPSAVPMPAPAAICSVACSLCSMSFPMWAASPI